MKIAISYPPIPSIKGTPTVSQSRQFQWFNEPTYIFPVIPAYAATMLKEKGFDVLFLDGIAKGLTSDQWISKLKEFKPDLISIETKTPVIQLHWKIIDKLKEELPDSKVVLIGDHVTALPKESLQNSKVDFVLTGGDFDFLLVSLAQHLNNKKVKLEPGIYYRKGKRIMSTGKFALKHSLNDLPFIDRDLVEWKNYAYKNGNFKKTPGTYTMAGRDCWWHQCKFCSWTTIFPTYRTQNPIKVVDEIEMLVKRYGIKEIMDDSGTFPVGKWLKIFCNELIKRGLNKKVIIDCNMRAKALTQDEYNLMAKAGFRFILYGFESGSQTTLDRINKGIQVQDLIDAVRMAKKAGLQPHITAMMGYPWETKEEAKKTIQIAKMLFDEGSVDTLQATIVIPYPGTPLYKECIKNGWLRTKHYADFDQRAMVMKSPMTEADVKELTQALYRVFFSPKYVVRKITSVRSVNDLKFMTYGVRKVVGHLADFKKGKMS